MAIYQDGSQGFGITATQFDGFVVEDFSLTEPSDSVDLQDGDGIDIGRVTIPRAKTFSLTAQVGTGGTTPTVGQEITYDSQELVVQEAVVTETQADYQRIAVSGYVKINT